MTVEKAGNRRSVVAAVALVIATVLVAGCSSSSKHSDSTTTQPASTSSSTSAHGGTTSAPPPTTAAQSSTTVHSTTTATVTPAVCSTSHLVGSLGSPDGTAGTIYYQLSLRNTGSTRCTLQGYPGVSFVAGSDGHQVGAPARRVSGPAPLLTVAPGASVAATLGIGDPGAFPNCQETPVLGLRVYPPGSFTSLFVSHQDTGCANPAEVTLSIRPLASS
jgi:Protein of unknown function (DUF4232)